MIQKVCLTSIGLNSQQKNISFRAKKDAESTKPEEELQEPKDDEQSNEPQLVGQYNPSQSVFFRLRSSDID